MKMLPAILLLSLAPFGAMADTVTFSWTPETEEQAAAIRLGLMLHSFRNGVEVRQSGRGHQAMIRQSGGGNQAVVVQKGRNHRATVTQADGGNALVLLQVGRRGDAEVEQTGGGVGIALQVGDPGRWIERLGLVQP